MRSGLVALMFTFLSFPVNGEPATARYAPLQVQAARTALQAARRMLRQGREEAARRLATQAATDARLSWAMTESEYLREQAAAIYAGAARIDRNALFLSMKEEP